MVATNTNPGVHACYLQSDSDPNFAMQTLLVSGGDPFDFRIMGTTDIVNVLFRNANNAGGEESSLTLCERQKFAFLPRFPCSE